MTPSTTLERRHAVRSPFPERVSIQLLEPPASIAPHGINLSEGGLCLRLQRALEVRSLVRMQLIPHLARMKNRHPIECEGRVAWVTQRLDLRAAPPFMFDTGIEFIDPPRWVRRFLMVAGGARTPAQPIAGTEALEPCERNSRRFLPQLEQESQRPSRWHLIVTVEGVPCFSGRYGSARAAKLAWEQFKRQQSQR